MLFASYFFVCFIGSALFGGLPFIGAPYCKYLTPNWVDYLSWTFWFFIYSYHRNKTLDMAVLDRHYNFLVTKLFLVIIALVAQLDRASDYGSEG